MTACSVEDCGLPVLARGWCTAHYQRWSRHGDPLAGGTRRARTSAPLLPCSYEGCERMARRGNTICKVHQLQEWRQAQGPCSVEGCPRQAGARGLCIAHYQRWRTGKDWQADIPEKMKRGDACLVEDCPRPVYARGYCGVHYQRWSRSGDPGPVSLLKAERGAGSVDPKRGYRYITVNGCKIAEHRHVMEQMLGRPLEPWESPHHRNGQRADNRPENLELWVKPQPAGQRLEDLITFIVEHYPGELEDRGWSRAPPTERSKS